MAKLKNFFGIYDRLADRMSSGWLTDILVATVIAVPASLVLL